MHRYIQNVTYTHAAVTPNKLTSPACERCTIVLIKVLLPASRKTMQRCDCSFNSAPHAQASLGLTYTSLTYTSLTRPYLHKPQPQLHKPHSASLTQASLTQVSLGLTQASASTARASLDLTYTSLSLNCTSLTQPHLHKPQPQPHNPHLQPILRLLYPVGFISVCGQDVNTRLQVCTEYPLCAPV